MPIKNKGPVPPKKLSLLMTVMDRGTGLKASEVYRKYGLTFNLIAPARGAAGSDMLDILGITESEKDLVISTVVQEQAKEILNIVSDAFHFDKPGTGIAFSIPIVGVSGPRAFRYIMGDSDEVIKKEASKEGEEHMNQEKEIKENTTSYSERTFDLVITIVNRGHADHAVDAARSVGSHGGTILYARGTGIHEVEKFFGISIQPEKEVVLSLIRRTITKTVVHEIVEKAGLATEGRGLCFVLPVEHVAGIQHPLDYVNSFAAGTKKAEEEDLGTVKK